MLKDTILKDLQFKLVIICRNLVDFLDRKFLIIVIFLIIIFSIFLFLFGFYRPYDFSYDEFNTLAISANSIGNINYILSNEQNFPLYYYLIKFLSFLGTKVFLINYFFWAISCLSFYFVTKKIFIKKTTILYGIFLFVFSPSINYYSTYTRMYILIVFLSVWYIYFYTIAASTSQNKKILSILFFLGLIMSALHPSLIIFWIFMLVSTLVLVESNKLILILSYVFNVLTIAILVLLKSNPFEVFFRSLDYVEFTKNAFYNPFSQLYLQFSDSLGLVLSFMYFFCVYFFIKKRLFSLNNVYKLIFLAQVYIFCFFVFLDSYFIARYYVIFNIFFILSILVVFEAIQNKKYKKIIVFVSFSLILLLNIKFYNLNFTRIFAQQRYCESLSSLTNEYLVISSYRNINLIFKCSSVTKLHIFGWNGLTLVNKDDSVENLVLQAKTGGFYAMLNYRPGFLNYLEKNNVTFTNNLDGIHTYVVYSLEALDNKNSPIYGIELSRFKNFGEYEEFLEPSSYVFKKK